jgi:hypothetical protein
MTAGEDLAEDERETIRALTELVRDEQAGRAKPGTVSIGPFSAFIVIGALQLAWRHPGMPPAHKEIIEGMARQMQGWFGGHLAAQLERGWDPSQDVDTSGPDAPVSGPGPDSR